MLKKWQLSIDNKGFAGGFLSKAFNIINQQLLLTKLHAHGFSKQVLAIIYSYLSNRKQRITSRNSMDPHKVLIAFLGMPGHAWPRPSKIISSSYSFNRCMQKINFITPLAFDILKLKNPAIWLAKSIFAFNHAHLKLHDQCVALIDMKLHA